MTIIQRVLEAAKDNSSMFHCREIRDTTGIAYHLVAKAVLELVQMGLARELNIPGYYYELT